MTKRLGDIAYDNTLKVKQSFYDEMMEEKNNNTKCLNEFYDYVTKIDIKNDILNESKKVHMYGQWANMKREPVYDISYPIPNIFNQCIRNNKIYQNDLDDTVNKIKIFYRSRDNLEFTLSSTTQVKFSWNNFNLAKHYWYKTSNLYHYFSNVCKLGKICEHKNHWEK